MKDTTGSWRDDYPPAHRPAAFEFAGWRGDFDEQGLCPDCGEVHETGRQAEYSPPAWAAETVERELRRLGDSLVPAGWDVYAYVDVLSDDPMAFVHVFVNGSERGFSTMPGESFWDAPDERRRFYGVRVFASTVDEALREAVDALSENVDDVIAFFGRWPGEQS